jgi:arginine exporter protein ArgO
MTGPTTDRRWGRVRWLLSLLLSGVAGVLVVKLYPTWVALVAVFGGLAYLLVEAVLLTRELLADEDDDDVL